MFYKRVIFIFLMEISLLSPMLITLEKNIKIKIKRLDKEKISWHDRKVTLQKVDILRVGYLA